MKNDSLSKTGQFFVKVGKKYKLLFPFAVVGLALTMLWSSFINYIKNEYKRFVFIAFLICFFVISNSFLVSEIIGYSGEDLSDENDEAYPDTYSLEDILNEGNKVVENEAEGEGNTPNSEDNIENAHMFDKNDSLLILINKQHPIPDDYEFKLGTLSKSMQCDERIINDLLLMMDSAKKEGVNLVICSPYREDSKQEKLFNRKIDDYMKKGYSYMDAYKLSGQSVTVPGASEHQVGLALDIVSDKYSLLEEGFAKTEAGIWLNDNCARFGFVVRYPKDKEDITGIEYEPWHFRYVGRNAAKVIMEEGISLEEFWDKYL